MTRHQTIGPIGPPKVHPQFIQDSRPRDPYHAPYPHIQIPIRNGAQLHVQRQEGFTVFCLIQCVPFALGWVSIFHSHF